MYVSALNAAAALVSENVQDLCVYSECRAHINSNKCFLLIPDRTRTILLQCCNYKYSWEKVFILFALLRFITIKFRGKPTNEDLSVRLAMKGMLLFAGLAC